MSTIKDDPRDDSLAVHYSFPPTWHKEPTDGFGTSGMFLSGLIMVTRNRFIAWPAALFGINQVLNAHPLRKEDGGTGWSNFALCVSALVAAYIPMFLITPTLQKP